jgi:hypothetical protein
LTQTTDQRFRAEIFESISVSTLGIRRQPQKEIVSIFSRADLKRAFSTLVIWKPAEVIIRRMKHWEIIADNLSKAGWSWGCVSAVDSEWRTIWIVDALYVRSK